MIIIISFIIKLCKKSPENAMLYIIAVLAAVKILFSMLYSTSIQHIEKNVDSWERLKLYKEMIVSILIILTVFSLLFKKKTLAMTLILITLLINVFTNFYMWQINVERNCINYIPEYSCIGVSKEEIEDIIEVNKYILQKEKEGYNVRVLDIIASKYMIPLHRNNYKFDLMLDGNLGYNGEEKLIEEIKSIENILILRQKPEIETIKIQQPEKIDKFIEKTYKKLGELNNLEIFN